MQYRRATVNDIDAFVKNRMEFVAQIKNVSDVDAFERSTKQYLAEYIDSDNVIIFIAIENNQIVASCMACIFNTAPLPSCLSGKTAEILNIYTLGAYRKKGHARKLLEMLLNELKNIGVEKVLLEYTADGLSLYEKMGFSLLDNQMQLKLV